MATYYVDPINGNNANPGTFSQPKKTIPTLASGDRLFLASGVVHSRNSSDSGPLLSVSLNGLNDVVVQSYDAGYGSDLAIVGDLARSEPGDNNWVYVGSGIWRRVFAGAYNYAYRMFIGARGSQYSKNIVFGTPVARAYNATPNNRDDFASTESAAIARITNTGAIWYSCSNNGDFASMPFAVYVYTGSSTVSPPNFYDGLAFLMNGAGTANGFIMQHATTPSTNIVIKDVAILNGLNPSISIRNASGVLIENINVHCVGMVSVLAQSNDAANYVKDVTIKNITIDARSSLGEKPLVDNDEWLTRTDIININDNSSNIVVDNVHIKNAFDKIHCAFLLARWSTGYNIPRTVVIKNSSAYFTENTIDARALASDYSENVRVIGCEFIGSSTVTQINGRNITVSGCKFAYPSKTAASHTPVGQRAVVSFSNYVSMAPESVVFANNFIDARASSHSLSAISLMNWTALPVGSITIANNVAYLNEGQTFVAVRVQNNSGPVYDTTREQNYYNNVVFGSTAGNKLLALSTASDTPPLEVTTYTPLSNGVTITNPKLNSNFEPSVDSPLLKAGRVMTTDLYDSTSRMIRYHAPDIGPCQVNQKFDKAQK